MKDDGFKVAVKYARWIKVNMFRLGDHDDSQCEQSGEDDSDRCAFFDAAKMFDEFDQPNGKDTDEGCTDEGDPRTTTGEEQEACSDTGEDGVTDGVPYEA